MLLQQSFQHLNAADAEAGTQEGADQNREILREVTGLEPVDFDKLQRAQDLINALSDAHDVAFANKDKAQNTYSTLADGCEGPKIRSFGGLAITICNSENKSTVPLTSRIKIKS